MFKNFRCGYLSVYLLLKHIEGLGCHPELFAPVTLVGNQLQQQKRLGIRVPGDEDIPGQLWVTTVDVTLGQDHAIGMLILDIHVVDLHQQLLCLLVISSGAFGLCEVIVEGVVVHKVAAYGVHVDQDLFELFVQKECRCHALTPWNSVALGG